MLLASVKRPLLGSMVSIFLFVLACCSGCKSTPTRDNPNEDVRASLNRFRYVYIVTLQGVNIIHEYFIYYVFQLFYLNFYFIISNEKRSGKAIIGGSGQRVKETTSLLRQQNLAQYKLAVCADGSPAAYYAEQREVYKVK